MPSPVRVFAFSIVAGLVAGLVLAVFNSVSAGPYIEKIGDDYSSFIQATGDLDFDEYEKSLQSLYLWQLAGPIIIGLAAGGAFAVVYLKLASSRPLVTALIIAGVAWFSLYAMPAAKYPANPEALFDAETAKSYNLQYVAYAAASGLAALGSAIAFSKMKRKNWPIGAAGVYLAIIAAMYFAFPAFPEVDYIRPEIVMGWRSISAAGMTAFWFLLGIIAGILLELKKI